MDMMNAVRLSFDVIYKLLFEPSEFGIFVTFKVQGSQTLGSQVHQIWIQGYLSV